MMTTEQFLDTLIQKLNDQNQKIQAQKQTGPWGWLCAFGLSLLSLVGLGVALFLAQRQTRALAQETTRLIHEKLEAAQKEHQMRLAPSLEQRTYLLNEVNALDTHIRDHQQKLNAATHGHQARLKKLDALRTWKEINEG